jgi:hypothetical protein
VVFLVAEASLREADLILEDNACIINRFRSNTISTQMSKKPSKPSQKDNARVEQEYTFTNDGAEWKQLSELADRADKKRVVKPKYGVPPKRK